MSAATGPINAAEHPGIHYSLGLAADTVIYPGVMVGKNAAGNILPAANAANLIVLGRAETLADNTGGSAGDVSGVVKPGVFAWGNSATNALTVAHINQAVYVEDDNTVASVAGTHGTVAGIFRGFDGTSCWIDTTQNAGAQQAVTLASTNGTAAGAADLAALKTECEKIGDDARAIHAALVARGLLVG
jgi:hypothetical protein